MRVSEYLSISLNLLHREFFVLKKSWRSKVTNALVITCLFFLTFGSFMPAMGMPNTMILPAFIGSVISFCLMVVESVGFELSFDLTRENLIGYHCALPLPASFVVGAYALGSVMRTIVIMVPIFLLGVLSLSPGHAIAVNLIFAPVVMLLTFTLFALLFLSLALFLSTESMMGNMWPRLLVPLFIFGCNFYPWHSVTTYAPRLAWAMSFNPFTMATEGMRAALLGPEGYLSFMWCIGGLFVYCVSLFAVCMYGLRRRVVPVSLVRRA